MLGRISGKHMNIFQFQRRTSCAQSTIAIFVGLLFFSLLPFASALEIHHIFSEVDYDGHEHSDFDLCQWGQVNNGNGSIDFGYIDSNVALQFDRGRWFASKTAYYSVVCTSHESRGPPLFS